MSERIGLELLGTAIGVLNDHVLSVVDLTAHLNVGSDAIAKRISRGLVLADQPKVMHGRERRYSLGDLVEMDVAQRCALVNVPMGVGQRAAARARLRAQELLSGTWRRRRFQALIFRDEQLDWQVVDSHDDDGPQPSLLGIRATFALDIDGLILSAFNFTALRTRNPTWLQWNAHAN